MHKEAGNRIEAPLILAVDDDAAITKLVRETLEPEGFMVDEANSGAQALRMFEDRDYGLVILDVMMPGIDGFETCSEIRKKSDAPIIFLSAKDEESDKVVALTLGGDDYVTKPFKPRELVARIRARLRRRGAAPSAESVFSASSIEVDLHSHTASLLGVELDLTPKEFDILAALVRQAGHPVSAKELYEEAWHEEYRTTDANTVMVHIRRLRSKLAKVDSSQMLIQTVFGVGYKVPIDSKDGSDG